MRWAGRHSFPGALALCSLALGSGCDSPPPPTIPVLSPPPPLPLAVRPSAPGLYRITITGGRAALGAGVELELKRGEALVRPPAAGQGRIVAERVRLVGARMIATRAAGGAGGAREGGALPDLFARIPGQRLEVGELVVENGEAGVRGGAGEWVWRVRELALQLHGVALGGEGEVEGWRDGRGWGELDGRRVVLEGVGVRRSGSGLEGGAAVKLGRSRARLDVRAERNRDWRLMVAAETLDLGELHGLWPALPAEGEGEGVVEAWGGARFGGVEVGRLDLRVGGSRVALRGRWSAGEEPELHDVLIEAAPLRAVDLERMLSRSLPLAGSWAGWVAAGGSARDGLMVRGEGAYTPGEGDAPPAVKGAAGGEGVGSTTSTLAFGGMVRLLPRTWLDLELRGAPLRVADTAFDVALELRGAPDSLALQGRGGVRGVQGLEATVDALLRRREGTAPVLEGSALLEAVPELLGKRRGVLERPIRARAEGRAVLARDGALDVRIAADSLPLAALPWPERVVAHVRGVAGGAVHVGGTLEKPALEGRVELGPAAFVVRPLELQVDSLRGALQLEGGRISTDGVSARAGGATLRLEGAARPFGEARELEVALHAEQLELGRVPGAKVKLSAELGLVGSPEAPRLSGRIYDLSGHINKTVFKPKGVAIDLEHPPYAELARKVPWPARSRLRQSAPARPPPVQGEVTIEVTPDVRVSDRESELFGTGRLQLFADSAGWKTRGMIRLEGGYYAFFGERFRVSGGAVQFDNGSFAPRVALLADHDSGHELGASLQETTTAPQRFPPLVYFVLGPAATAKGELLHWSLFRERLDQLAESMMYGAEPDPVTGWQRSRVWRADDPKRFVNHRAAAQAAPLLWSYIANESYGIMPLSRVWLQAGNVVVGNSWPTRLVVGSVIGLGASTGRGLDLMLSQPLDGGVLPGLRLSHRLGAHGTVELFSEPRFSAAPLAAGRGVDFLVRRKTGVGARWRWER